MCTPSIVVVARLSFLLRFLRIFHKCGFVERNRLLCHEIAPVPIALIDGTVNAYVTCIVLLLI